MRIIVLFSISFLFVMTIGYAAFNTNLNLTAKGNIIDYQVDITDDVVTSGDGLYEDEYESGRYVYKGTNPNNYIEFNDELWRIVSKETDGTYKIIRNELLPQNENYITMAFDEANNRLTENNTYCSNSQYGCGIYAAVSGIFQTPSGNYSGTVIEDSSIKEYLNNTYYNSLTDTAKSQIISHSYNIGAVELLDQSGSDADSIAKNIVGEKMYQWNGHVGLVNVSDILRASLNSSCKSATSQYNQLIQESSISTCDSNYLLESYDYWTINYFGRETHKTPHTVWTAINKDDRIGLTAYQAIETSDSGVRPVVFLKPTTILKGVGSYESPFRIVS